MEFVVTSSDLNFIEVFQTYMCFNQIIAPLDLVFYVKHSGAAEGSSVSMDKEISDAIQRVQVLRKHACFLYFESRLYHFFWQNAIRYFNSVCYWAAATVIMSPEVDRKGKFEFFVQLMRGCLSLRNYNTAYAILLGLKLRAVSRLELSDSISEEARSSFQELSGVFSYQGAHKAYRGRMKLQAHSVISLFLVAESVLNAETPAIPNLGILLRDITYLTDGSADFMGKRQVLVAL
jgi:hypothetical protein